MVLHRRVLRLPSAYHSPGYPPLVIMSAAARQQAKSAQINPNWPHYASAALTVAVLVGSFLRWGLLGT